MKLLSRKSIESSETEMDQLQHEIHVSVTGFGVDLPKVEGNFGCVIIGVWHQSESLSDIEVC